MSEYQYYDFQTIDRPLTDEEQAYISTLSRRVALTPHQAVFTYSFGDLRRDALQLLTEYFDALLYEANWGTKQLAFRFPRAAVDLESWLPYRGLELMELTTTPDYVVLNLELRNEEPSGWVDAEGKLAPLLGLRHDLLRGDRRVLYLAWLKAAEFGEPYEDEEEDDASGDDLLEPPVPSGLGRLSRPLLAFVDFFEIDPDLIAAAATASPRLADDNDQIEHWVGLLPEAERDAFLVRLARGEPGLDAQLLRRLRQVAPPARASLAAAAPRRTFAELRAAADEQRQRRQEAERREAERARRIRLEAVAATEAESWERVASLIAEKKTTAYDEAVTLLKDLQDLANYRGQRSFFDHRIAAIRAQYPTLTGLRSRLHEAKLLPMGR